MVAGSEPKISASPLHGPCSFHCATAASRPLASVPRSGPACTASFSYRCVLQRPVSPTVRQAERSLPRCARPRSRPCCDPETLTSPPQSLGGTGACARTQLHRGWPCGFLRHTDIKAQAPPPRPLPRRCACARPSAWDSLTPSPAIDITPIRQDPPTNAGPRDPAQPTSRTRHLPALTTIYEMSDG